MNFSKALAISSPDDCKFVHQVKTPKQGSGLTVADSCSRGAIRIFGLAAGVGPGREGVWEGLLGEGVDRGGLAWGPRGVPGRGERGRWGARGDNENLQMAGPKIIASSRGQGYIAM